MRQQPVMSMIVRGATTTATSTTARHQPTLCDQITQCSAWSEYTLELPRLRRHRVHVTTWCGTVQCPLALGTELALGEGGADSSDGVVGH